jgi:CheY-like chemotaxis protein
MSTVHTESLPDSFQDDARAEEIEQEVREALAHLHDPDFQPSARLCELVGCGPENGQLAVQTVLIQAIEDLKPPPSTPPNAFAQRAYDLLRNRFLLKLTLEETAQAMHAGVTSVWRVQRGAVHALARRLWARRQGYDEHAPADVSPGPGAVAAQAEDWRSQAQRELASLRANAPGAVSDVGQTIEGVLQLMTPLLSSEGARAAVRFVQPQLVAAVHPAALRQMLIAAVRRLAQVSPAGEIAIYAGLEDGNVRISLSGPVGPDHELTETDLIDDIVVPDGLAVRAALDGPQGFLWIEAPSIGKVNVLVVDDNPDMVRFYRSSTLGTRYHVLDAGQTEDLFERVASTEADVIVLDVMLPGMDGWELLMRVHEDPATRSIPVVVCSVIREEKLALSLGATRYLSKPVSRREFIQALDAILPQASAAAPQSQAHNGATG